MLSRLGYVELRRNRVELPPVLADDTYADKINGFAVLNELTVYEVFDTDIPSAIL